MNWNKPLWSRVVVFLGLMLILSNASVAEVRRVTANVSGGPVSGVTGASLSDISPDGTYVAFYSQTQLLAVNPGSFNAYLRNLSDGSLHLASVDETGAGIYGSSPTVSSNGLFAAFENGVGNRIYRYDRGAGTSKWINPGTGMVNPDDVCKRPIISADGRYIAFYSRATNLVAGDTNGKGDIFLYDHQDGSVALVSRKNDGGLLIAGGIDNEAQFDFSRDGRFVFFSATDSGVTDETIPAPGIYMCYRRNLQTGVVELVSKNHNNEIIIANFLSPRSSDDGSKVALAGQLVGLFDIKTMIPGHSNTNLDVYVRNLDTGNVWLGSATPSEALADSPVVFYDISGDGSKVAFSSAALNIDTSKTTTNIRDVFVGSYDGDERATAVRVSKGPAGEESDLFSDFPIYAKQANLLGFTADDYQPILGIAAHGADEQGIAIGDFPGGSLSPFATWIGGFGLAPADLGAVKDPDKDGRVNLLEYIAGSNPSISDRSNGEVVVVGPNSDGSKFQLIVPVRKNRTGFEIGFEVSSELSGWDVGSFTQVEIVEDLGDVERIRYEITIPPTSSKFFVRFTGVEAR